MTKLIFSLLVLSQFVFALEKVSLQLLWKHQFEFAGFYIAKEKGFYKDVGLDITFKEYEFGVNIVQDVLSNKTNIGIGRSSLVLDKLKGKDVTLLFATFQNSPYVLISKKRDDLNSVQDFKNKRIMLSDDLESLAAISTMMKINNLSQDDYEVLQHSFEISDLINNNTDLMTTYLSNEPYYLEEQGVSYNVFNPKDYGISFYSDIVFTSKKFADTNPRLVQKFDEASLKGWKYAFENIDETIEIILQKYNSQNKTKDALKYEARILKGLAYQYGVELGDIDDLHIREIANLYRLLGMTNTSNHVLDEMIFEPFIFSNWIKQFFTLQMFLIVNSIILLVILMFSYKQYILRKATNILEKRVKKEVEKSRQHERQIFEQAKMVSMGEMIGNIAHQWRQPLSAITTNVADIELSIELDEFDEEELLEALRKINTQAQYLSETINTFRDFLKDDKKQTTCVLQKSIDTALDIVHAVFQSNHIEIKKEIDYATPISLMLIEGELEQVIINILNNAKDALLSNKIANPWVLIVLSETEEVASIRIEDNAGGIPQDIIDKVFEAYFTTKHESQGTGLGLHMSYNIVTQSLGGKLIVKNIDKGAQFLIELPK